MAAASAIRGGPELKLRLQALGGAALEIGSAWQTATASRASATAPRATGRGAASIRPGKITEQRAQVDGAYWLIFVDRGTRAHDIRPKLDSGGGRGGKGKAHALKFEVGGSTVFARRVHKRRQARRPFITEAAQAAIRPPTMSEAVIGLWNRKRRTGRWSRVKA